MLTMIIDGNNTAHRAKHAYSLTNPKGIDVSITFGFLRMMASWCKKFKPDSVIVCWDGGVPEFRRQAVPSYKANRHKDDDPLEFQEFIRQVRELSDYVFPMLGVITARKEDAEADDLIFHATKIIKSYTLVVSTDMDMIQTINYKTSVYHPHRDIVYNDENIESELGIPIGSFIDWRAIQGDGSDNIPGVPGIGDKTATKLFKEWGTLTGITNAAMGYNPKGSITGKLGDNIRTFGFERIARNIYVMALHTDRVGARRSILEAVNNYQPCNPARLKKYLINNSFASLIGGEFTGQFVRLSKPELVDLKAIRVPTIQYRRIPV